MKSKTLSEEKNKKKKMEMGSYPNINLSVNASLYFPSLK
jgi:hypothetical protein